MCLQCIKKALEERRCLQRLVSAPLRKVVNPPQVAESEDDSAKPEGASTISEQSGYGSRFMFFYTLISLSGLFLLST